MHGGGGPEQPSDSPMNAARSPTAWPVLLGMSWQRNVRVHAFFLWPTSHDAPATRGDVEFSTMTPLPAPVQSRPAMAGEAQLTCCEDPDGEKPQPGLTAVDTVSLQTQSPPAAGPRVLLFKKAAPCVQFGWMKQVSHPFMGAGQILLTSTPSLQYHPGPNTSPGWVS